MASNEKHLHSWIAPENNVVLVDRLFWGVQGKTEKTVFVGKDMDSAIAAIKKDGQFKQSGPLGLADPWYTVRSIRVNSMAVGYHGMFNSSGNPLESEPTSPYTIDWNSHISNCESCREKLSIACGHKFHLTKWKPLDRTLREVSNAFIPTGQTFPSGEEVRVTISTNVYVKGKEVSFLPGGDRSIPRTAHI